MPADQSVKVQPIDKQQQQIMSTPPPPHHTIDLPQASHPSNTSFLNKHVLTVSDFTKDQLHQLFNLAHHYRLNVIKERPLDHVLKGKVCTCEQERQQ